MKTNKYQDNTFPNNALGFSTIILQIGLHNNTTYSSDYLLGIVNLRL